MFVCFDVNRKHSVFVENLIMVVTRLLLIMLSDSLWSGWWDVACLFCHIMMSDLILWFRTHHLENPDLL